MLVVQSHKKCYAGRVCSDVRGLRKPLGPQHRCCRQMVGVGKIVITPSEAVVLVYIPFVNYILSDCIVLWRAWVLWNRRFILFIPPLIFILCTLAISVASAVFAYEGSKTNSVRKTHISYTLRCMGAQALPAISIRQGECYKQSRERPRFLVAAVASPVVLFFRLSLVQIVGIYPTAIFVVVTMRMSATDILSHPGRDPRHQPPMIFAPSSPTAQPSILAMTAGSSSDRGPHENRPTRILASSDPEKGGKIVRSGYVA
ncbi:hypothetical protein BJV78DRAFT_353456 [Lactifluus subvellereus]|nr:hypothetical protein BJV78DRAFT_353456 [Lactifluus subvellereus]